MNDTPLALEWRNHSSDFRKCRADTTMHQYVTTDLKDGRTRLTVYENHEPLPVIEKTHPSLSLARQGAQEHARSQAVALAHAVEVMRGLGADLRAAVGRGYWQGANPEEDHEVAQVMHRLGCQDFEHPLFTTEVMAVLMADTRTETFEQAQREARAAQEAAAERRRWPEDEW